MKMKRRYVLMNNMKLKFENGSDIKIIGVDVANKRSKRGQEQLQEIKDYYKHNPDKFAEEMLGIKLFPYQRIILKLMFNEEVVVSE